MTFQERHQYFTGICKKIFPGCPYADVVMHTVLNIDNSVINNKNIDMSDYDRVKLAVGAYIRHTMCIYDEPIKKSNRLMNKTKLRKSTKEQFLNIINKWKRNN